MGGEIEEGTEDGGERPVWGGELQDCPCSPSGRSALGTLWPGTAWACRHRAAGGGGAGGGAEAAGPGAGGSRRCRPAPLSPGRRRGGEGGPRDGACLSLPRRSADRPGAARRSASWPGAARPGGGAERCAAERTARRDPAEPGGMVKLTAELIEQAAQYTNAVRDRELDLRGARARRGFGGGGRLGGGGAACAGKGPAGGELRGLWGP